MLPSVVKKCLLPLLVAAACAAAYAEAGGPETLAHAISGLSSGLVASDAASKPMRIAFLSLSSSDPAESRAKDFGLFFSERLAAAVKGENSKIRIFERQRLDAILAEHELDASGAVDAEGAMKIGELAPVDAVFTGSYTRVGGTVAVNAKLVSVVSGEVLFARALTLAIDDSIADFFPDGGKARAAAPAEASDDERLKAALSEMRALLADLSSDAKVAAAAAKASSYPLFGTFAPVQELAAETFVRYKKASPAYRAYLLSKLSAAALVGYDDDVYALLDAIDYLSFDGALDDAEFSAIMAACRAMRDVGYYNVVLKHLLLPEGRKARLALRIGVVMSDIQGGRMGKPVGIEYSRGLLELLGALQDDTAAFLSAYDPYIASVPKAKLASFASPLKRRFEAETDEGLKSKLLDRIADNANAAGLEAPNAAEEVYSFFSGLDRKDGGGAYARAFASRCGGLLSKAMPLVPYNKEERILLCLRYGISCPGLVPAYGDIVHGLLLGDGIEERRASASMLEAMGARAAPAEATVDKVLGYLGDGSIDGMGSPNLQMQCLNVLANIGARDPLSLTLIAAGMRHDYSDVREAAAEAFLKIGAPSLPYVLEIAKGGAKAQKLEAIKLLARMGRAASGAASGLEAAMKAEKDGYVKDAMADALAKIRP